MYYGDEMDARWSDPDGDPVDVIDAGSPEHLAEFTVPQLRELASSRRPEHIVTGYAALLELVRRGEELP